MYCIKNVNILRQVHHGDRKTQNELPERLPFSPARRQGALPDAFASPLHGRENVETATCSKWLGTKTADAQVARGGDVPACRQTEVPHAPAWEQLCVRVFGRVRGRSETKLKTRVILAAYTQRSEDFAYAGD
jgi:hypothetical protein